jgi:hypothetical protein
MMGRRRMSLAVGPPSGGYCLKPLKKKSSILKMCEGKAIGFYGLAIEWRKTPFQPLNKGAMKVQFALPVDLAK